MTLLDVRMGGPSVQQFTLSPGVHVTPVVDYTTYDWDSPGSRRREVRVRVTAQMLQFATYAALATAILLAPVGLG